jgi:hypothetical protein
MATRRSDRSNITKSYKNSCGAPAPKATLDKGSNLTVMKSMKPSNSIHVGGDLVYTMKGSLLSPGSVSDFLFPFYLLANGINSGAVAAEMGEQWFFVQPAK